jgi:hypothetical protein
MGGENSAALATRCNPAVFLAYHNSGQHHPDSIRRLLPAADALGGAKLHCLLNFFEAVTSQANAVTFTKSDGLVVTLCDVGLDGLMLGAGTMVDEHDLSIVLRRQPRCSAWTMCSALRTISPIQQSNPRCALVTELLCLACLWWIAARRLST